MTNSTTLFGVCPFMGYRVLFVCGRTVSCMMREFACLKVLHLKTTGLTPFPHDKILDLTKLKAFADDKLDATKMIISVFDRVENIVGKGEIACTSNFSFSHGVF